MKYCLVCWYCDKSKLHLRNRPLLPNLASYHYVLTGVVNVDNEHYIRLSPNPVTSLATVTFNLIGTHTLDVQIVDTRGVVYRTYNKLTSGDQLNISTLTNGVYIAKIFDPNQKKLYIIKILKL